MRKHLCRRRCAPVFYGDALWNVSVAGTLDKIDPGSGNVLGFTGTVPVLCGLAACEDSVWVSDCNSPTVVRVDPVHTTVLANRLPVPDAYLADATQDVAVGAGSLWVGQGFANPSYVWRFDPPNRTPATGFGDSRSATRRAR